MKNYIMNSIDFSPVEEKLSEYFNSPVVLHKKSIKNGKIRFSYSWKGGNENFKPSSGFPKNIKIMIESFGNSFSFGKEKLEFDVIISFKSIHDINPFHSQTLLSCTYNFVGGDW